MKYMFLYRVGIILYGSFLQLAALFHPKARKFVQGRKRQFIRLEEGLSLRKKEQKLVWFHSASLGEFEQTRPLIERYKEQYPDHFILLTFFSPSGYEIQSNYELADYVCYMPLDTPSNARKFVEIVGADIVCFAKYEFWYYHITEAFNTGSRVILFSALFREDSIFLKRKARDYRKILEHYDQIFVQDEASKERLKKIKINHTTVLGDTRSDRVIAISKQKKSFPKIESFRNGQFTIVVGSSWKEDIKVIAPTFSKPSTTKLIIAPHELKKSNYNQIKQAFGTKKVVLYSELQEETAKNYDILIIDNIGMLSSLYYYADIAYVGGAFGKGLHNILEAAVYGIPVLFGSKYKKFREAIEMVERDGAFSIKNNYQFDNIYKQLKADQSFRIITGNNAKEYVLKGDGASDKIIEYISQWL